MQCKRYRAMTKKLLYEFWASACCQVETRTTVPKVMERNNREIQTLQFPLKILQDITGRERSAIFCGKNKIRSHCILPMFNQGIVSQVG